MASADVRAALRAVIEMADAAVVVADEPRQQTHQPRLQQFAIALHRHAKGAKAAAAAWLQELGNQET